MEEQYRNINQALIDRCRMGERKAQSELYSMYYRSMYSVSLRILGNATDAEDAMQEAFLSAFRSIDSYQGKVSFGAWLRKIVINRSLDQLKKRKMKFEEVTERNAGLEEDNTYIGEVDVRRIHKAIQSLPDGYRVVLSLHLVEGYDHEEISQILNISNSASRTQYLRAKNKLREILKNQEIYLFN
ncbi:MAG TPA: RNA polymerase sigma factor [Prolixibacteraceae bacterium]|nr:RNA polymerase sigma factor [Prolixibacteraceae bacterium]